LNAKHLAIIVGLVAISIAIIGYFVISDKNGNPTEVYWVGLAAFWSGIVVLTGLMSYHLGHRLRLW
jgi:hypothetical protein